ncbi:MAG: MBL fold metallo-hydrolase [Deltaproteobacteria bacterium]|nr:MBL fold metallo-hydrolase [Deltaproteobacteria bacterium]
MHAARLEHYRRSPNFKDGQFVNPLATEVTKASTGDVLAAWFRSDAETVPHKPLPVATDTAAVLARPPASAIRVTWIGHSTVLLELEGRRILTDPIFADRASPTALLGPKRFSPPAVALEQLPPLDAVVISHDHFDHLDWSTIRELAKGSVPFVVPLGVAAHLEKWGVAPERIRELDWWEQTSVAGLTFVAVPARHFSGRTLERNTTLWAAWVIKGRVHRAFFGGDGGLFDGFAEIGRREGPFDLTLLEIGASNPLWGDIHLGPTNALRAHAMLRGRLLLPIHWATFDLGLHAWYLPGEVLAREAEQAGVRVAFPAPGEPFEPLLMVPTAHWWEQAR